MKLINLNISIKIDNSEKVAEFLSLEKPDIIVMQEVVKPLENKVFDQYKSKENIEKIVGISYPYKFFGPLWCTDAIMHDGLVHRDFGGLVEQGNELMSKYPIISATNEFFYKHYSYELDWSKWYDEDHGRAVLITELNVDGKKLQILNLHGIWTKDKMGDHRTMDECKYILSASERKKIPTIIVGDFNLLPESESLRLLDNKFRNLIKEYKISSTRPDFEDNLDTGNNVVDYIFVNDQIKVNDFKVIDMNISDHLPLSLDFEII